MRLLAFERRRVATLAPPILLLATVLGSYFAFVQTRESRAMVVRTHRVIETAQRVNVDLLQAEASQRGYQLTGNRTYLRYFAAAVSALEHDTAELRRLTRDNPSQQRRLATLDVLVDERLNLLRRGIEMHSVNVDSALASVRREQGRAVMDSIHSVMEGVDREEQQLLAGRVATEQREMAGLAAVFLLGLLTVSGVAYLINRAFAGYARAQAAAAGRIEEQNEQLQAQAVELELQRDSLEEQAVELEAVNEQLSDRTMVAELSQEKAEAERRRADAILASISDAFFMVDFAGRFHYVNAPAEKLFRSGREELLDRSLWDVEPAFSRSLEAPFREAVATREVVRLEEYYPELGAYYVLALYPAEDIVSVFLHDVTPTRATEAELKVMSETMPQLVWSATAKGRVDYWNERWRRYTGVAEDAGGADVAGQYLHPDDVAATLAAWERSVATGKPFEVEYRIRRASDGAYRWFLARALPVRAPDGRILRWSGTCTDIHDARATSEAVRRLSSELKAQVAELETMFEILPIGVSVSHDAECRDMRVNRAFARLLRVSEQENISRSGPKAEMLPYRPMRGDVEIAAEDLPMQRAARLGRPVEGYEYDLVFADGERLHIYGAAAPLLDAGGEVRGAVGAFVDVSRQVRAESAARRLADRTSKLYALSAALSRAVTPEQVAAVAVEWGRAVLGASACMLAAVSRDGRALEPLQSVGFPSDFMERWPVIPLDTVGPVTEAVRTGGIVAFPSAAERAAALPRVQFPAAFQATMAGPLRFEDRVLGAWTVHFDGPRAFSTEDIQLFGALTAQCAQALERARLFEAESRAREGAEQANQAKLKFLRVMSHDLRTPLNAILGYTELLLDGVAGPLADMQRTYLGRTRASTAILRLLIEDILEFARIEAGHVEMRPAEVTLTKLLDGVEALMGEQVRARGIRLVRDNPDPDTAARADPERARQVLMNLVSNAMKFTAAGGEIALECEATEQTVRIAVRDTGVGIPADEIDRIFEPFVQAHRPRELGTDQGVGLGLAISRELARAMGGDVTARAGSEVGSVFTLELPRVLGAPAALARTPSART